MLRFWRYRFKFAQRRRSSALIGCLLLSCLLTLLLPIAAHSTHPSPQLVATPDAAQLHSAQTLNAQGQQQLEQGNPTAALATWQQAEALYRSLGDLIGVIGTQFNQAKALQALGFYQRAKTLLEQLRTALAQQPDSSLQANVLLSLGNVLRIVGELDTSETLLKQSLAIAERLGSRPDQQAARLHLGNIELARQQPEAALRWFEQAAAEASPVQLTAQLRQLNVLLQLDRPSEAVALLSQLQARLAALPPSQRRIYGQIELAASILGIQTASFRGQDSRQEKVSGFAADPQAGREAARLLAAAVQQAQQMGDRRAESYALGRLGQLYERTQQQAEAQRLTQQALILAEAANAPEIAYQWQWQLGRLLKAQGNQSGAIAAYTQAVATLRSLRQDLVAVGQDVQFSFREQVEPVYRELVDLLLTPSPTTPVSQAHLKQAREVIESLQLAELNNFFREACLDAQPRQVDNIDPTAAVIYPIILRDRLEVILSLPGQPLRHYTTQRPQADIEAGIQQMQRSFRVTSFATERLAAAQQLYQWLIQPAADQLAQQGIQTLVFVLDGSLRNLPMAALYTGTQYLIEQYRIAITPSLQLLSPRSLAPDEIRVLVGSLSQAISGFSPLPGVEQEVQRIQQQLKATVLMNQAFTTPALATQIQTAPFSVVHLATHGQFGSQAKDTFLVTWDRRLNVNDLQTLLTQRNVVNATPIELLVLSACQTAQGDKRAALGMAGMAVRSGARSTLATLWTVNDQSTAVFISQFYQTFTKPGITRAEAVRQAQLALLKQPNFSHPYYWAPFILVGNWI
jgi:CHAT domain-containing protein